MAADLAVAVVERAAAVQKQIVFAIELAVTVVDAIVSVELQCAAPGGVAGGVNTGGNGVVVGNVVCLQMDIGLRGDYAVVVETAAGAHLQRLPGVELAVVVNIVAVGDADIAAGAGAAGQRELAAAVNLDIAGLGRNVAQAAHADAGFGADQADLVGIHAAQLCEVDGDGQLRALAGDHLHPEIGVVDQVGTADDIELIGPEFAIDLHAARNQINLINRCGVHAADADVALPDA